MFHLDGTAAKLVIQLSSEDCRGPDFVLAGVRALPGEQIDWVTFKHNERNQQSQLHIYNHNKLGALTKTFDLN